MNQTWMIFAAVLLAFVLIFACGFALAHKGKPYSALLFNAHKMIALALLIFLIIAFLRARGSAPLGAGQILSALAAAVCFVAMFVTGGLLSIDKAMPTVVARVHEIAPYLTAAASLAVVYLFLGVSM